MRIMLPPQQQGPPDLKIDLLSESNSTASNSPSPYSPLSGPASEAGKSKQGSGVLLGAPGNVSGMRRHSHNVRAPHPRNKSAPVTPLNRSTTNVHAAANSSR